MLNFAKHHHLATIVFIILTRIIVIQTAIVPLGTAVAYDNQTSDHHGNESHSNQSHDKSHDKHSGGSGHGVGIQIIELHVDEVMQPLVFTFVVIIAALSKLGFHHANFLSSKVPESCMLIIIGVLLGGIIRVTNLDKTLPKFFSPHEFFLFLLPPIILEAAFCLNDRTFGENIGSILLYAVVGTLLACFFLGLTLFGIQQAGGMPGLNCTLVQMLVFTALIVAVDPVAVLAVFQEVGVNNVLYFLVFGESLLNDGVTVVLYNVMQTFNRLETITADQIILGIVKFVVVCFGGLLIGVVFGAFSSFVTKYTNRVKVVEPIAIFGFTYFAFIVTEMFHLSGIICIIGCGMMQAAYALHNVTPKSRTAIKYFAKVMSTTSEIIIFMFLGLAVVTEHSWNTGLTLCTIFFCVVYRFIITFVMTIGINRFDTRRVRKITIDEMFMISYGGLRGAVCFSLVMLLDDSPSEFPMKNQFVTTTLVVVLFTVFVQGISIKPLVKLLRVKLADQTKDMIMYQELNSHVTDHMMAGIEEVVGYTGKFVLRETIDHYSNLYIRPHLLKDYRKSDTEDLAMYYEKLVMKNTLRPKAMTSFLHLNKQVKYHIPDQNYMEHYKNLQLCGVSNMPRVGSDLRSLDSSACLQKLAGGKIDEEEEEEEVKPRKKPAFTLEPTSPGETLHEGDLRRLFSRALQDNSRAMSVAYSPANFHDKNLTRTRPIQTNLVGHLQNKRRRNARLSSMRSIRQMPERALSWSDDQTALCEERAGSNKLKQNRAVTVDLSSTPRNELGHNLSLEDTVFEVDEEKYAEKEIEEKSPLLPHHDTSKVHSGKQVTFDESQTVENSVGKTGAGLPEKDDVKDAKSKKDIPKRADTCKHMGDLHRQDAVCEDPGSIPMVEVKPKDRKRTGSV